MVLDNQNNRGRPLVQMHVNGILCTCFLDTGSEVTIISESASRRLNIQSITPTGRTFKGASGAIFSGQGETSLHFSIEDGVQCIHPVIVFEDITFPGDVLLGIDFVRRFNFQFVANHTPPGNYMSFDDVKVPFWFSDLTSLGIRIINSTCKQPQYVLEQQSSVLSVMYTMTCPPKSGCFVKTKVPKEFANPCGFVQGKTARVLVPRSIVTVNDDSALVWIINDKTRPVTLPVGMSLASVSGIDNVYSNNDSVNIPGGAEHSDTVTWEDFTDEFDEHYGIGDFGYSHNDFDIFPPVSMDVYNIETPSGVKGIIPKESLEHLGTVRREMLFKVLERHSNLFDEDAPLGCIPDINHNIITSDGPIRTRQWRLPESARDTIRQECEAMLREGIIEPSTSPWLSPVVLVRKKDGGIRFCIDFRNLNKITRADSYPMPRLDETIDRQTGTHWFTALDAKSAYWTVEVNKGDRQKTAFTDGYRLFQFKRMPFGLATAPSTFQRAINAVLHPVLGRHTLAFLDDVVVASRNFDEHLQHLDETMGLLAKAGFRLNLKKCKFAVRTFKFLGHLITPDGVLPDPDKVKAILQMTAPQTVKQVRQFLGATGFFRKHVKDYAAVAAPLSSLLKKWATFHWGPKQQAAFEALKCKLASEPILKQPDFDRPFEVHCDASGVAIGACLIQRDDQGKPHAVAYFSRKLREGENKFPTIDVEALAVVEAVRTFDSYLYGRPFVIVTDHRPLVHIFSRKTKSLRMTRWSHELSFYNYKLIYKPGASHHVPDLLSRKISSIDEILDPQTVAAAQQEDPLWSEIRDYLQERRVPRQRIPLNLEEFEMRDNLLYHLRVLPGRVINQLVIPRALRTRALDAIHSDAAAAHPGIFRTYCRLRDHYYFPQMLAETKKYVSSCLVCQRRKGRAGRRAPLASMPEVSQPMERVSVDLIDLMGSTQGNRYVLAIIDHFTRYLQLIPLPNKEAQTVADAFIKEYVTLFGPPRLLVADNGREFHNRLFSQVCQIIQTQTHYTTRYHPEANGMIERSNRVVKDALATLVGDYPDNWDEMLPFVRLALNSAVHRSVGQQPLYLLTGKDGYFPQGLTNEQDADEETAQILRENLRDARRTAKEAARTAQRGWARDYNRRVRQRFDPVEGDLVLLRNFGRPGGSARALGPRWSIPARIVKKIGPVNYLVREPNPPYNEVNYHINQMRPYIPVSEIAYPESDLGSELDPEDVVE